jgi:hypothetical protein
MGSPTMRQITINESGKEIPQLSLGVLELWRSGFPIGKLGKLEAVFLVLSARIYSDAISNLAPDAPVLQKTTWVQAR